LFSGVGVEEARAAVGWPLALAAHVGIIDPPEVKELETLRALHARTRQAHARPVAIPL
jgi:glutaconate CoA-transferase subunit B